MKNSLLITIIVIFAWAPPVRGENKPDIYSHDAGIWEIAGVEKQQRWIVIHNLPEARQSGIFHIEVIGRTQGRPAWDIVRICPHLAITAKALQASVLKPLPSGQVYPEAFDDALAQWQTDSEKKICGTSVAECLTALPKK